MTEYRLLVPREMPTAVKLWVGVFGVPAEFFESLLAGGAEDDFSVGAFEGSELVSSVHVFGRRFRNREGHPLKVGGIGSVSTLPSARKKGHSGRLLTMAIEGMEERGCAWSYLGTGVHDHYARYGWRTVSTPTLEGIIAPSASPEAVPPIKVDDDLLEKMSEIYAKFSVTLPMANERSITLWKTAVRYRVTAKEDEVNVLYGGAHLRGYLVCRTSEEGLELVEAAGEDGAVAELVARRLSWAASKGMVHVSSSLPLVGEATEALRNGCEKLWGGEERSWMVRPIAERISWPDLAAIHADPRGRRSALDNF